MKREYSLVMYQNGDIAIIKNLGTPLQYCIYHKCFNLGDNLEENLKNAYSYFNEIRIAYRKEVR